MSFACFFTLGLTRPKVVVAKRADQSSPRVDVEKQARNLNTKGTKRTKRTKKKEIDA
jgi:hypothetical protein